MKTIMRQDGGVVATEFALILPVLLLVLMGVIELTNALQAERKLLNATQTVADLIGQKTDLTTAQLDDIYLAANLTLAPLSTLGYTIGVSSVRFDDLTGDPVVDWSGTYNGGTVTEPLVKAVGRGEPGASIIIVSSTYLYRPLIKLIIPVDLTLKETSYVRPRKVSYVAKF
jgi:Flp pilus assembly protein TadG